MNIILLGPPGAGKGTQAKRLEASRGMPHIASGDIFRDIRREDTPLARQVQEFMDRGEYVPDDLTIELVLDRLSKPDAKRGFVLDGFPRTLGQADALDEALQEENRSVDRVLYISAPVNVIRERIADRVICFQCHAIYNMKTNQPRQGMQCDVCGHRLERRSDETPELIDTRFDAYLRQTEPLVRHYRLQGRLVEVDGTQSLPVVQDAVDEALAESGARA